MTQDELIQTALQHLNVVAAGQPVSAEDRALVSARLPLILGELNAREVCYVANVEAIPNEWGEALSIVVAKHMGPSFGVGGTLLAEVFQMAENAEERLRIMTRKSGTGGPLKVERFLRPGRYGRTWL